MAKFVELKMVVGPALDSNHYFDGEVAEDSADGPGRGAALGRDQPVAGSSLGANNCPAAEETLLVSICVDEIREFYPRKGGRVGTRIVFKGGAGRPVTDSYADVKTAIMVPHA